jgi:hypothetical protein
MGRATNEKGRATNEKSFIRSRSGVILNKKRDENREAHFF